MSRLRQAADAAERASSELAAAKYVLETDLQRHNREREAGGMINATKQVRFGVRAWNLVVRVCLIGIKAVFGQCI